MNKRRMSCLSFLLSVLLLVAMMTLAACPTDDKDDDLPLKAGPESGRYYYKQADEDYTITLSNGDRFSLYVLDEAKAGTYDLTDGKLTLTFYKEVGQEEPEVISATHNETYIDITYKTKDMRFLKKVAYTVSFDSGPAAKIDDVLVFNGDTVSEPAKPLLLGYHLLGWYTSNKFDTPFAFDTQRITKDTTIYAKWVVDDPTVPEYLVDFELSTDQDNPKQMQTIGGKLYNLPDAPTRAGYNFKDWWISSYDDAEKLSYKYEEDMILQENTTLYAYWQPIPLASNLIEPYLWVDGDLVTWQGITNANYILQITRKGQEEPFIDKPVVDTSYEVNFSDLPAGDYIIKLIASESNESSDKRIYYKNKALSRVSHFAVTEPGILTFNDVQGATSYIINIDVNDKQANLYNYNNGTNTFFNFSNYLMPATGIKFTVTAKGQGRADSTRTFTYNRILSKITELVIDEETETISWEKVPNATNYILSISSGNSTAQDEYIDVGSKTSYSFKEHAGQKGGIIFKVRPKTKGWNSPDWTTNIYDKIKLAAPRSIQVMGRKIVWDKISNATSYDITIGSFADSTQENIYELPPKFEITEDSFFLINIQSKGEHDSLWSDSFPLRSTMSNLFYQNSTASWDYVIGAKGYEVFVNNTVQSVVESGENFAKVVLTAGGTNIISVRAAFEDDQYSDAISIEVYAHTVRFQTGKGEELAEEYYATGDQIRDKVGTRDGYDFDSWYLYFGQSVGGKFTDKYYEYTGDIVLHATWQVESFTINYDYAGGLGAGGTYKVGYDSSYTLDVPTIDDGRIFGGWYTMQNGLGRQLTDELGQSKDVWTIGQDTTVYAFWANAITYHAISEENGWLIESGPEIDRITNLIIPAQYRLSEDTTPQLVLEIDAYGFVDCSNLVTISLADTISFLGTNVFAGCENLESIEVYDNNAAEPVYTSLDGVLFNADKTIMEIFPLGKYGEYEIPDTIISIKSGDFSGATRITKIIIPASVHSAENYGVFTAGIDEGAFLNCTALETIEFLPSTDQPLPLTIADTAFQNCYRLTEVNLPERLEDFTYTDYENNEHIVKGISTLAFYGCINLKNINVDSNNAFYSDIDGVLLNKNETHLIYYPLGKTGDYIIPDSVTTIGEYSFINHTNPFAITIASNVIFIELSAFECSTGLKALTFSHRESELVIKDKAFRDCSNLEEIIFKEDSKVVGIGDYAFQRCTSLIGLIIPDSITNIGIHAFANCSGIKEIIFKATQDDGVLNLGISVFNNCTALEDIKFEEGCGLVSIPNSTFDNCTSLMSIELPAGVQRIGAFAFKKCILLESVKISANVSSIGASAFIDCKKLSLIEFEAGTTDSPNLTINNDAFVNCIALTSIDIPARATEISLSAFSGCVNITSINVDKDNDNYSDIDGVLFNKGETILIFYPQGKQVAVYSVPNGVKTITAKVFANSAHLEKIIIPISIELIEEQAFNNCTNLVMIEFTDGTNQENLTIQKNAFQNCTRLESINLPSHLKTLESYAFLNCTSIQSVSFGINSRLESIVSHAFSNCTALATIIIPKSVTNIEYRAFYNCYGLNFVSFESGGTGGLSIGATNNDGNKGHVFENCSDLSSITIPARAVTIEKNTFLNCRKLINVGFDANSTLEFIGEKAFSGCSALMQISIPKSVKDTDGISGIGSNAFEFCSNLLNFSIIEGSNNVLTLGDNIFKDCIKLQTATIPSHINGMPSNTFNNCYDLKSINVHIDNESLSSSETGVLFNKSKTILMAYPAGLTTAYIVPKGVTSIAESSFINASITQLSFEGGELPLAIGANAFQYCRDLDTVTLPDRLTKIGSNAFQSCSSLTQINLPSGLTTLDSHAFADCSTLKTVTFVAGINLEEISSNAFQNTIIESIAIPDSVKKINSNAFDSCIKLNEVVFSDNSNLTSIGSEAFLGTDLRSFTIPKDVTSLGSGAFKLAKLLETVDIPSGVTNIDSSVFEGCSILSEIKVDEANTSYKSVDGILFSDNMQKLILYPVGKPGSYAIPKDVNTIGKGAFAGTSTYYNTALTSVTIPNTVTSIESNAFRYCSGLRSVIFEKDSDGTAGDLTIGNSTSSYVFQYSGLESIDLPARTINIRNYAFDNCSSLTKITFEKSDNPKHLTIGNQAFRYSGLTSVEIPARTKTINKEAFRYSKDLTTLTFEKANEDITALAFSSTYTFADTGITSVEIPARLTNIGTHSFRACTNLERITFEKNGVLTEIKANVFADNPSLISIHIPKNIQTINNNSFSGCINLKSVTFEDESNMKTLGGFIGCASLSKIDIPDNVTEFTTQPFRNSGLTSITIPVGVKKIPDFAFANTLLKSITIPQTVEFIGTYVFQDCTDLKEVILPNTINKLGDYMFNNCTSLITLEIPNTVTSIDSNVFQGCKSLTEIIIPEGVTSIGNYAFEGCESLASITLPSTLTSIGTNAFQNCASLTKISLPSSITQISNYAFNGSGLINYNIPNTITRIGEYAFGNCINLTQINIPASVTNIGINPFEACENLEDIDLASNNLLFSVVDGVLYNVEQTKLLSYPAGKSGKYEVLSTVDAFEESAFAGSSNLTHVIVPSGVNSINSYSFKNCTDLTKIEFKGELTTIGYAAFENTGFREFTVSNSVTSIAANAFKSSKLEEVIFEKGGSSLTIGQFAFEDCTSLTSLEFPNHLSSVSESYSVIAGIGSFAFRGCTNLTQAIFDDGNINALNIGESAFDGCTKLAKVVLPDSLKNTKGLQGGSAVDAIASSVFKGCINLIEVVFKNNDGSVNIGRVAFEGCEKLTNINISQNVESISTEAFLGCSSLKEITIPESVRGSGLNSSVFKDCINLETVNILGELTSISSNLFQNCTSLKNIEIPSTVTQIYANAFDGCSMLPKLNIPTAVTRIEQLAFSGCTSLLEISVPSTVMYIGEGVFNGWRTYQTINMGVSAPRIVGNWDDWHSDWDSNCYANIVWA